MARLLSPAQIYKLAVDAGFTGSAAVTATAIALAESNGGDPSAVGDRNLTGAGEKSVGLWQINYRPWRDTQNAIRDPQANLNPATNARAAFSLYRGRGGFGDWSTYNNGAYRAHLPAALAAAGGSSGAVTGSSTAQAAAASSTGSGSGAAGSSGPDLNPFTSSGGGLLGKVFGSAVGGIGHLILPAVFVLGGVVLVVGGVYKAATAGGVAPRAVPVPLPI